MKIFATYFFLFSYWAERTGSIALTKIKGLSLSNLGFYLFFGLWALKVASSKKLFEKNPINKYFFILFFVLAISIPIKFLNGLSNPSNVTRELMLLKNILEPYILYFLVFNLLSNEDECKRATFALFVLLLASMCSMFLVHSGLMRIGNITVMSKLTSAGRSSGLGNPNDYASFIVLFFPINLYYLLTPATTPKRFLFLLISVATIVALIITGSRGGMISFFLSMLLFFFILHRKKVFNPQKLIAFSTFLLFCVLLSIFLSPSQVKETVINKSFNTDPVRNNETRIDKFTSGRTRIFRNAITLFTENPIIGNGQGTFIPLLEKKRGIHVAAHNLYLSLLIEYGLIGLIVFAMLLYRIFIYAKKAINTESTFQASLFYACFLSGYFGYVFSLIGVNGQNSNQVFWIYVAVATRWISLRQMAISEQTLGGYPIRA